MLSVNNLSVQFGKRVLFDEVNLTFSPVTVMESLAQMALENLHF